MLKLVNCNSETPYLIWNNGTRAELLEFLEAQQEGNIKRVRKRLFRLCQTLTYFINKWLCQIFNLHTVLKLALIVCTCQCKLKMLPTFRSALRTKRFSICVCLKGECDKSFGADIVFTEHSKELIVGEIFVRVYNEQPTFPLEVRNIYYYIN